MEFVKFGQGSSSQEFSPKYGSKDTKSNTIQDLLARSRTLRGVKLEVEFIPGKPRHCAVCGESYPVGEGQPVGWSYIVTRSKSGKLESVPFCSEECIRRKYNDG